MFSEIKRFEPEMREKEQINHCRQSNCGERQQSRCSEKIIADLPDKQCYD